MSMGMACKCGAPMMSVCSAHAASSQAADRIVPGPCTARDRPTATASETIEQTAVQGHKQTQRGAVPQLRNDGQRCLPHPWWRDAPLALAHRDALGQVESLKSACASSNHRSNASGSVARSLNIKSRSTGPTVNHSGKRWVGRDPRSRRYTIDSLSTMLRLGQGCAAIRSMKTYIKTLKCNVPSTKHGDFPSN
jgi:hypothetical protein